MDPHTADLPQTQQEIRDLDQQFQDLIAGLRESYANEELKKEDFQNLARYCWNKRVELADENATTSQRRASTQWKSEEQVPNLAGEGSATSGRRGRLQLKLEEQEFDDRPDYPAAYAEILTTMLDAQMAYGDGDDEWKRGLRYHYNSDDPELPDSVWCPILREYAYADTRTAAHIVPPSIGYFNVGYIFGDPNYGAEDIWSANNGLVMASHLRKQFDRGDLVLVPIPGHHRGPCEWQMILLDEKLKKSPEYARLDHSELEFKNNNRPDPRFLYLHFTLSILSRYARSRQWFDLSPVVGWSDPRPYLRRTLFSALIVRIVDGDRDPVALIFDSGLFGTKDDTLVEDELLMADKILAEWDRRCVEA